MLFNIVLCVLVAYICVTPYFYAKAIKFGMKIAEKPEEAADMPIFNLPKITKKPKMTPEEDRMMQILSNIDRYDGTPNGQVEVKKREK